MADRGSFVSFDKLLSEVEREYFDLNSRDSDSDGENSDWTSACAFDVANPDDFVDIEGPQGDLSSLIDDPFDVVVEDACRPIANDNLALICHSPVPAKTGHCIEDDATETLTTTGSSKVNLLTNFNCKCQCLAKFNTSQLEQQLHYFLSMNKSELDLVILGKISTFINNSATTGKLHKHKEKQRERKRCKFSLESISICREAFLVTHGIGRFRFVELMKHYVSVGIIDRDLTLGGRRGGFVTLEDSKVVIDFLGNAAAIHSLALPGRVAGFKKEEVKVMPSSMTVTGLHQEYVESCALACKEAKSRWTFRRIWKSAMPWLLISKPSSDLCWQCHENNTIYMRATNVDDDVKIAKMDRQREHLARAKEARVYMNDCVAKCKEDISIGAGNVTHISFDFAQQVHYPSDPHQPGPIYFKTARKCGLFGVCNESKGEQVNYLIDEAVSITKGANCVISLLHHYLEVHATSVPNLMLHADNCCGQNKNNFLLFYLAWRVMTGLNQSIELNFLIAGHTKFMCDQMFGIFKKRFRVTKVSSLDEIAKVLDNSCTGNMPQLVGTQDGTVLVRQYDWKTFFKAGTSMNGIRECHQFSFHASRPGVVVSRKFCGEKEFCSHNMLKNAPLGLPQELVPPGMDLQRRKYLYSEIREFCSLETQDLVCPAPNGVCPEPKRSKK